MPNKNIVIMWTQHPWIRDKQPWMAYTLMVTAFNTVKQYDIPKKNS